MERFRVHGDKIVARIVVNDAAVTDCPRRQEQKAEAGRRKSLSLDDLEKFLSRPPRTIAEWAERMTAFWKERTQ
jgi:uncharacterized protein (DUF1800 family)